MANFARVKPAGWALNEILTSAQMNTLDADHAKAINGDGGSTHGGLVQLEQLQILSSGVGKQTGAGKIDMSGAIATTKSLQARRLIWEGTPTQVIDVGAAANVTINLDLTSYGHFIVTFNGFSNNQGTHSIVFDETDTDADKKIKKGSIFVITFKRDGTAGGFGFRTGITWPSNVYGLTESDKRCSQASSLLAGAAHSATTFILRNVGDDVTPIYLVEDVIHTRGG